jgi:hypothetical protein
VKRLCSTLIAILGLGGSTPSAHGSPITAPAPFYLKHASLDPRNVPLIFPPAFEREQGVSWDGKIEWKAEERAWVFAAALEGSLKGISRVNSPYRLSVAVVRVEKLTGTFVVEFTILDPTGESVELLQVEGVCPVNRSSEDIYPAVAGEIVHTFKKSVLQ